MVEVFALILHEILLWAVFGHRTLTPWIANAAFREILQIKDWCPNISISWELQEESQHKFWWNMSLLSRISSNSNLNRALVIIQETFQELPKSQWLLIFEEQLSWTSWDETRLHVYVEPIYYTYRAYCGVLCNSQYEPESNYHKNNQVMKAYVWMRLFNQIQFLRLSQRDLQPSCTGSMGHYNRQAFAPFAVKHPYSRAAYMSTPKRFNATIASGFSINLSSVERERQLWAIGIDSNMDHSLRMWSCLEIRGPKLPGASYTKPLWRSLL